MATPHVSKSNPPGTTSPSQWMGYAKPVLFVTILVSPIFYWKGTHLLLLHYTPRLDKITFTLFSRWSLTATQVAKSSRILGMVISCSLAYIVNPCIACVMCLNKNTGNAGRSLPGQHTSKNKKGANNDIADALAALSALTTKA